MNLALSRRVILNLSHTYRPHIVSRCNLVNICICLSFSHRSLHSNNHKLRCNCLRIGLRDTSGCMLHLRSHYGIHTLQWRRHIQPHSCSHRNIHSLARIHLRCTLKIIQLIDISSVSIMLYNNTVTMSNIKGTGNR